MNLVSAKPERLELTALLTPTRLLARNATLNLTTNAWIFLVLIVAMPRLVAHLGQTAFGLFSLAWVVIGYLAFLDIGVNRAATKFVSEHLAKDDRDSALQVVRTALLANSGLGLAGAVIVVVASPYLVHLFKVSPTIALQAEHVFCAVALAVPVLLIQGVLRAVLSSLQRFGFMNLVDGLTTTCQWVVAVVLAAKGCGVAWVVLSTVLARLFATLAFGVVVARLFPRLRPFSFDGLHHMRPLLHFGGWVSVTQIVSPLLVYFDRVLIGSWISLAAVTLYTVPFEAMSRLRIIPTSLMGTMYPAFSERCHLNSQDLRSLYERSVRYLLLMLVPGILYLVVVGRDLFTLWMGADFSRQVAAVVRILAIGILANALAQVPSGLLQALGRPDITGKLHLLELPLHIVLCLMLIPLWGIRGAAAACAIRFVLDSGLLFWAAGRYCGCSLASFWAAILPRIVLPNCLVALFLVAIVAAFQNPWIRVALGLVALGLGLVSAWVFGVERAEKPRISGMLRRLLVQTAS